MDLYEDRDENFGNARDVRNLFEQAVARQSDRVARLEAPHPGAADGAASGGPDGAGSCTLPKD